MVLATVLSFLLHSAALACLSLMNPTSNWRWVAVQTGQSSVALQATMASAPPDGRTDLAAEVHFTAKPEPPKPPEPSPLERALADVPMEPVERRPVEELASLARPELPSDVPDERPVPEAEPHRPVQNEQRPDLAELAETVVPLPRTDVGRKHAEELPPGAELSYPTPASAPSEGAKNQVPSLVYNPAPAYPAEALQARLTGRTLLRVAVAPDGSVAQVRIHKSSGSDALDQAALRAVQGWKFSAAEGTSALRELLVPVRFVLEEP